MHNFIDQMGIEIGKKQPYSDPMKYDVNIIQKKLKSYQAFFLTTITQKRTVKSTNTQRLNNTFINKKQVIQEIKREVKKIQQKAKSKDKDQEPKDTK